MKFKPLIVTLIGLIILRVTLAVTTPVFDTSEARYAAIAANMARTGDFLVPRFTYKGVYQSFDGKPPLLFQAGGVACRAFGVTDFAVRLPVLLATFVLLAILYRVVFVLSDRARGAALLAVLIAFSATAYYALAGFCMTDGLLVTCVAGAILCHAALVKTHAKNWSLGVFALLGCGMLVKGPVALVEFGLPVFLDTLVNRRWTILKQYRWFTGALVFFVLAAPWFVLMARENPGFLTYFFVNENLLRFLVHEYGDKYGAGRETFRGMALIWLAVVTLPWSPLALYRAWTNRKAPRSLRSTSATSVLGWGLVGITGFWTLTSRVPVAYLIPTVPLFAGWIVLKATEADRLRLKRLVPFAAGASALVLVISLVSCRVFSDKMDGADAPFKLKRYSYEFYHGVHGIPEEVAK